MIGKPASPAPPEDEPPRAPRMFRIDDPAVGADEPDVFADTPETTDGDHRSRNALPPRRLTGADLSRGFRWGALMLSAMAALATLSIGLWFTRFVSVALERQDWVGWLATSLAMVIAIALSVILVRELIGFRRLARLSHLRKAVTAALAEGSVQSERKAVKALAQHYRGRPDAAWGLSRLTEHAGDVLSPGELLRLADREVLAPLDGEARRIVLASAKRVATVTALSPLLTIAMVYVLVENVRMFRGLAALYGGRPGVLGGLRLAKLVVGHIIATGGVAMTDDLIGQFLGQDLLRRLSHRLGEGAFNGALTARLGAAAVEVMRPMPFLDTEPIRVREILAELFKSLRRGEPDQPKRATTSS